MILACFLGAVFAAAAAWALHEAQLWRGAAESEGRALERTREQLLREKRVSESFERAAQRDEQRVLQLAEAHRSAVNILRTQYEERVQTLAAECETLKKRVRELEAHEEAPVLDITRDMQNLFAYRGDGVGQLDAAGRE